MDNNNFFTNIEDEKENNLETIQEEEKSNLNPFVTGLPNWDLEPLYETIKRGNQE